MITQKQASCVLGYLLATKQLDWPTIYAWLDGEAVTLPPKADVLLAVVFELDRHVANVGVGAAVERHQAVDEADEVPAAVGVDGPIVCADDAEEHHVEQVGEHSEDEASEPGAELARGIPSDGQKRKQPSTCPAGRGAQSPVKRRGLAAVLRAQLSVFPCLFRCVFPDTSAYRASAVRGPPLQHPMRSMAWQLDRVV